MHNAAYDNLTNRQTMYVDAIREHASDLGIDIEKTEFSRAELRQVSMKMKGKIWIPNWITHDQSRRVARGMFSIPEVPSLTSDDGAVSGPDITEDTSVSPVSDTDAERIAEEILVGS